MGKFGGMQGSMADGEWMYFSTSKVVQSHLFGIFNSQQ